MQVKNKEYFGILRSKEKEEEKAKKNCQKMKQ